MPKDESVAAQWVKVLREGGYEPPSINQSSFAQIGRYTRIWRKLHRLIGIEPGATFFEFGCGGGQHLIPLALHGHQATGIDASVEVLDRCREHIGRVEKFAGRSLPITLVHGDFLEYETAQQYDVVFNFGVVEHFLDDGERLAAIRKMVSLTKGGGHIVSVVPNGSHPLRTRQRAEKLGGYDVPEIDYDESLASAELLKAGAMKPSVVPANLFGYLNMRPPDSFISAWANKLAFYGAQLIPVRPSPFAFRHAGSLIIIGQRSASDAAS